MTPAITKSMSGITAVVLAVFVGYGASWYFGLVEGNFSLLLFLAAVVTGIYWLAERFYFQIGRASCRERVCMLV